MDRSILSIQASKLVWAGFDREASHSELLVMLSLADFAKPDGSEARPAIPTIAERVRLSVRQVQTILTRLVQSGWLTIDHKSKGGRPSSYRLSMDRLSQRCSPDFTVESDETPQHDFTVQTNQTVQSRGGNGAVNHEVQTSPSDPATVQFCGPNGAVHTAGEQEQQNSQTLSRPLAKASVRSIKFTHSQVESIYDLYPRKIKRGAAMKAIEKALKIIAMRGDENPLGFLQDRVLAFAQSPAGQAGKYTPHPASWFNAEQYDDDPSEWQRDGGGNSNHQDELDFPEHTEAEAVELLRRSAEMDR